MARGRNAEAESVAYRDTDADYGLVAEVLDGLPDKIKDDLLESLTGRPEGYPAYFSTEDVALLESLVVSIEVDTGVAELDPWAAESLKERVKDVFVEERIGERVEALAGARGQLEQWMNEDRFRSEWEQDDMCELDNYALRVEREAIYEALSWDAVGRMVDSGDVMSSENRQLLMERLSFLELACEDDPAPATTEGYRSPLFAEHTVGYEQQGDGDLTAVYGYSLAHGTIEDYLDVKGYVTTGVSNAIGSDFEYYEGYVVGRDDGDGGVQYGVLLMEPRKFYFVMSEMLGGADERGEVVSGLDYSGNVPAPGVVIRTLDDNFPVEWISREQLRETGTAGWSPEFAVADGTAREAYGAALEHLVDRRDDLSIEDLRSRGAGRSGVSGSVASVA